MAQNTKKRRRKQSQAKPAPAEQPARKGLPVSLGLGGLARIVPFACVAVAFVAVVLVYHRVFPPAVPEPEPAPVVQDVPTVSSSNPQEDYDGVSSNWLSSGIFTTGNKELDSQVKEFCDALTQEGFDGRENARQAYNTIVWASYEERTADETPGGIDWDVAAARHFFASGTPNEGKAGSGDMYDFAAAASFCLRYFGFTDAFAVPVVSTGNSSGQGSGAVVVLADEYGQPCVCDPSLGAEGFMLDRDLYNITVADIGQDLTAAEALGLNVQEEEDVSTTSSTKGQQGNEDESYDSEPEQDYGSYDDYSGYDYDSYGYDYDSYDYDYDEEAYYYGY